MNHLDNTIIPALALTEMRSVKKKRIALTMLRQGLNQQVAIVDVQRRNLEDMTDRLVPSLSLVQ
jgi:hypothetical protein